MAGRKVVVSVSLACVLFALGLLIFLLGPFGGRGRGPGDGPGETPSPSADELAASAGPTDPLAGSGDAKPAAAPGAKEPAESETPPDGRPVSLEGRVTDSAEAGVPGARVAAVDARAWRELLSDAERRFPGNPFEAIRHYRTVFRDAADRLSRVETDEDGRYAFRGLSPAEYRVVVTHEAYLPSKDSWAAVEDGKTSRCDVRLVDGYSVAGRVVDRDGNGVPGARVRARPASEAQVKGIGKIIGAFVGLLEGEILLEGLAAVSGNDGAFAVGSLEPVPQDLEATRDGYAAGSAAKVPPGARDVVVVLERGQAVSGRILSAEKAPMAEVELELGEPEIRAGNLDPMRIAMEDRDFLGERVLRATTDAEGGFRIEGVVDGSYEVRIRAPEHPLRKEAVEVRGKPVDLGAIVLARPERILGAVVDASGAPVEGAAVFAMRPTSNARRSPFEDEQRARVSEGVSGRGGAFALGALEPGEYDLRAVHARLGEAALRRVAAGRRDARLQLGLGAALKGRVLDAGDKSPVAGATVRLASGGGRSAATDESGGFEFQGIPQGTVEEGGREVFLIVRHPGYDEVFRQALPGAEEPVEILLSRTGGIRGTVLDSSGSPVEGARVSLDVPGLPSLLFLMDPSSGGGAVWSDGKGRFLLSMPGRSPDLHLDVVAVRTGVGRARLGPLERSGESWPEIELVLAPGVSLEGHVLDPDGRPVERARVRAVRIGELSGEARMFVAMLPPSGGSVAYSARDGSYRIGDLDPGPYRIEAVARGHAAKMVESVQVGPQGARQEILLDPGGTLAGKVVALEGAPFPGAEVVAFPEAPPPAEGDRFRDAMAQALVDSSGMGLASTKTDADGRYALSHLPEGTFRLVARAAGHESAQATDLEPGEDVPDLVLLPLARIVGRVTEAATGLPVPRFRVEARRTGPDDRPEIRRGGEEFDDPDGAFAVDGLIAGEYSIRISSGSLVPFAAKMRLAPGSEQSVAAALEAGLRVTGSVRTPDGAAIAGAYVYAEPSGEAPADRYGMERLQVQSDAGGKFAVEGLGSGPHSFRVWHRDYYSAGAEGRTELSLPTEAELELVLRRGGRVSGRIEDAPPIPPEGGYHLVRLERIGDRESADTDGAGAPAAPEGAPTSVAATLRDGAYSVGSLPPGRYRVELLTYRRVEGAPPAEVGTPVVLGTVDVEVEREATLDASARR